MKEKWINALTLAFTVALLPPIWAVYPLTLELQ